MYINVNTEQLKEMEKFTTNSGNPGIIINGHKFRRVKDTKTTRLWRCIQNECNNRCYVLVCIVS